MAKPTTYHEQTQIDYTLRLRELLKTLPPFARDFFRAMEPVSSIRTRMNYAYDIRVFFEFMHSKNSICSGMEIKDFPITLLDQITR